MNSLEDFDKAAEGLKVSFELDKEQFGFLFRTLNSVHTAAHMLGRAEDLQIIHGIGETMENAVNKMMVQFEDYPGQYDELVDRELAKQEMNRADCKDENVEMPKIGNYL